MKRFFADWRNSALIVALLAIAVMITMMVTAGSRGDQRPVVRVGTRVITQQEIITALKQRAGDQVLSGMISEALLENYAAQKGVSVTQNEVAQVVEFFRLDVESRGTSLEDAIAQRGMTMEDLERQARMQAMQVKLVVPEEDRNATVAKIAKAGKPFLPARYHIRQLIFDSAATAKKASALLNDGTKAGLEQAASLSLSGAEATSVHLYAPGLGQAEPKPYLDKALKGLKPGQCSAPMAPPQGGAMRYVVQLVKLDPAEKADAAKHGIILGMQLMSTEKYAVAAQKLEADALDNVDVQFKSNEFKKTVDSFNKAREESPKIPGLNGNVPQVPGMGGNAPAPAPTGK